MPSTRPWLPQDASQEAHVFGGAGRDSAGGRRGKHQEGHEAKQASLTARCFQFKLLPCFAVAQIHTASLQGRDITTTYAGKRLVGRVLDNSSDCRVLGHYTSVRVLLFGKRFERKLRPVC